MKRYKIVLLFLVLVLFVGVTAITSIKIYKSKVTRKEVDRNPRYVLLLANKQCFFLNQEFIYLTKQTNCPLVGLNASEISLNLKSGEKADESMIRAFNLLEMMKYNYGVESGTLYPDRVEFTGVDTKYLVIFPLDGSKSTSVYIGGLVLIIRQLNANDNNSKIVKDRVFSQIDFRFKNPVLR